MFSSDSIKSEKIKTPLSRRAQKLWVDIATTREKEVVTREEVIGNLFSGSAISLIFSEHP